MPNWCNNTVLVYHADTAKLKELVLAFNEGKMCNYIHPVPEDLQITAGRAGVDGSPEQVALEEAETRNRATHGYTTWYDFCVNEWGTKWDVGGDGMEVDPTTVENDVTLCFDSAWSPPCGIYERMVEQGFSVKGYYYEPGMAFAGVWWDGDDAFYEYGGMDSAGIAEALPVELDEAFGISESAAEWEAENAEDEENIDIDLDDGVSAVNEQEQQK
jgi:hypothetical protein